MALVAIIELNIEAWRIGLCACDIVGASMSRGMWRNGDWFWVVNAM